MSDREKAIEYLEPISHHPTITGDYCKHLKTALAALRAEEEREKGCGVVHRHRVLGGYKYATCPTCKTEIKTEQPCEGDYPYCGGCGKVILDAEQPFCGWCGRKLDGGGQDARKGDSDER